MLTSVALLFSGCAGGLHDIARQTGGRQSSQPLLEAASTVKKGMAMADVRRIVGKPAAIFETNGNQTWIYHGSNVFTA